MRAALERFGRVDVLVNNAGNFYAGFFEELTPEQIERKLTTNLIEPGFFRTELLSNNSTPYAELSIGDYAERTAQTRPAWESMSGKQTNDPAKLAKALLPVVDQEQPPLRWVAGADALETVEQKARELLAQVDAYRELSSSLAVDEPEPARSGS